MFQEFKLRHLRTVTALVVFLKESSVHEPVGEIRGIHPTSWPDENRAVQKLQCHVQPRPATALVRRQTDAMAHCDQCGTYLPRICRYCFANNSTGRHWDATESFPFELELTILGIVKRDTFLGASDSVLCNFECSYTLNVHKKGMLF